MSVGKTDIGGIATYVSVPASANRTRCPRTSSSVNSWLANELCASHNIVVLLRHSTSNWWSCPPDAMYCRSLLDFEQVSYSVHEVVRKDKYSKEDVTTPAEPVLTSRFVRVVNEMLCLLDTARSTELRMVPGRARRELLVLAAAWGRKAGEAVAPYLTERSQVTTSKQTLNNKVSSAQQLKQFAFGYSTREEWRQRTDRMPTTLNYYFVYAQVVRG